jgi:hypothetical protein
LTEAAIATPTASATATPPAPSIDISLPKPSLFWTRLFTWVFSAGLLAALFVAITHGQPAFAWPIAALLGLLAMFYVGGARAVDIVSIVQSSGIIRAAQSATGAVQAAADAATNIVHQVLPVPTTGGRSDLAS